MKMCKACSRLVFVHKEEECVLENTTSGRYTSGELLGDIFSSLDPIELVSSPRRPVDLRSMWSFGDVSATCEEVVADLLDDD